MNIKKLIISSLFLSFIFSVNLSLAESYPATCPAVAQGILNAIVGGCSNINRATYSNIYDKCCIQAKAPTPVVVPAPAKTPVQQPSAILPSATTSVGDQAPSPATSSLEQVPVGTAPSGEKTVEPTPEPQAKKEPQNILVKFFNWLFRRNK